jgi:microcystin-dependent protein
MSQPFLGEIKMFGGNFAPRGFAFCNGQLMAISQNTALFSLLGTTYGGNGQTTFALPNLQSRSPMHWGQGPGLSQVVLGEMSGTESVTLLTTQMPAHTHIITTSGNGGSITLPCSTNPGDSDSPAGRIPAISAGGEEQYADPSAANAQTAPVNVTVPTPTAGITGGSQPHDNRSPYLAVSFIIALEGIFPSRN